MIERLAGIMMTALLAAACGGGQSAPPSPPAATNTPAAVAPPATTPAAAAAPAIGELGVPECDAFARKYVACLEKVPASGQAMARQSFDAVRDHWRRVASNPARRSSLAQACQKHEEITKKAMAAYGCAW